jgi:hypothetical protein
MYPSDIKEGLAFTRAIAQALDAPHPLAPVDLAVAFRVFNEHRCAPAHACIMAPPLPPLHNDGRPWRLSGNDLNIDVFVFTAVAADDQLAAPNGGDGSGLYGAVVIKRLKQLESIHELFREVWQLRMRAYRLPRHNK